MDPVLPSAASEIDKPVMALLVSSIVVCAPGTVLAGASFTAATVTVLVATLLRLLSDCPSLTWKLMLRLAVVGLSLLLKYVTD
ncbi:hypothetical protein, partial [Polaromonas sp.]|uniref:hypothetical protein n=1 Tax=Polaromonas sp. TaxID=1869339 RepID=UPI00356A49C3